MKHRTKNRERRSLLVFITPTLVHGSQDTELLLQQELRLAIQVREAPFVVQCEERVRHAVERVAQPARETGDLCLSGLPGRDVLECTLERLRQLGFRTRMLATRWDIDRPEDVGRYRQWLSRRAGRDQ